MSAEQLNQIERMVSDLVMSVATLKAYFEEEKEENERRFSRINQQFEQIDKRFEQIDKRFEQVDRRFEAMDRRIDEVMLELGSNKQEHEYMASRLFRAEMEVESLKKQLSET